MQMVAPITPIALAQQHLVTRCGIHAVARFAALFLSRGVGHRATSERLLSDSDEGQAESSGGESSRCPTRVVRLTRGRRGRGRGEALTYVESEQESEEEGESDWN